MNQAVALLLRGEHGHQNLDRHAGITGGRTGLASMFEDVNEFLEGALNGPDHDHRRREGPADRLAGPLLPRPQLRHGAADANSPGRTHDVPLPIVEGALGPVVEAARPVGILDKGAGAWLRFGGVAAV